MPGDVGFQLGGSSSWFTQGVQFKGLPGVDFGRRRVGDTWDRLPCLRGMTFPSADSLIQAAGGRDSRIALKLIQ